MGDEIEQNSGASQRARLYTGENADADCIDQSAYSKIERGERYLSFEQCKRVAQALHTSMDYLAGLTDEKKPYPRSNRAE